MSDLTGEQRAAIDRRDRDTLLDAGAGSGKTTVLVERFARAVVDDGAQPAQVLAITFTEKAAGELRERVRARLRQLGHPIDATGEEGWISTIHGFCARVLRAHALEAGLDPLFAVIDADLARELADAAFDDALAECAQTEAGSALIAAHRIETLRGEVIAAYSELRARGARAPRLPPLPDPPAAARGWEVLAGDLLLAADEAARELGAIDRPGVSIGRALSTLARVRDVCAQGPPWPGAVSELALGGNAAALRTEACDRYRAALTALGDACALRIAETQRAVLDALLQGFAAHYAVRKRARGAVDFEDLELLARDLLARPEIGDRYRGRFAHVMVDELQDTNAVQLEIVDLVAGPSGQGAVLFMVGDAQQSIYAFRHADVELFEARGRTLDRTGDRLALRTNFRTRPEILAAINAGFAQAMGERMRPLRPGRAPDPPAAGPLTELLVVDKTAEWDEHDDRLAAPWRLAEAQALASRVAGLLDGAAHTAGDVVVLTRATTDLRVYEQALEAAGIPTFTIGGRGYWSTTQVVELVAYLRVLANPLDAEAMWTVDVSPLCGLSLDGLVLSEAGAEDELDDADRDALAALRAWLETERSAARRLGPEMLLERVIEHAGYDAAVLARQGGRRRLANVRKLLRLAREFEAAHGPDLHGFLALTARRTAGIGGGAREGEAPALAESVDAVRLMTIHRSKGLEFPVVCVADLGRAPRFGAPLMQIGRSDGTHGAGPQAGAGGITSGLRLGLRIARPGEAVRVPAPGYAALKEAADLAAEAEERRLFYVAMTRARDRLILSGAARLDALGERRTTPMDWIAAAFKDVPEVRTELFTDTLPGTHGADRRSHDRPPEGGPALEPPAPLHLHPAPPVEAVSYSALALYERCGYRFYAERVLGLPPLGIAGTGARERGIAIHAVLAAIDLADPERALAAAPEEHRPALDALVRSDTFARLAAIAPGVRREQSFAFGFRDLLITGVFDVLATEPDGTSVVVDYKTDALRGRAPAAIAETEYGIQRLVYALAALRTGAAAVDVVHVFLAAPDEPAARRFTPDDAPALEHALDVLTYGLRAGEFPVSQEPRRSLCAGCPAATGLCSWPREMIERSAPDRLV